MIRNPQSRGADAFQSTGRIANLTETNIHQIFGMFYGRAAGSPIPDEPISGDPTVDPEATPIYRGPITSPIDRTAKASITPGRNDDAISAITPITITPRTIITSEFGRSPVGVSS